jgi:hypothetical protein
VARTRIGSPSVFTKGLKAVSLFWLFGCQGFSILYGSLNIRFVRRLRGWILPLRLQAYNH